ncbi:MFS transporter [Haloferax sp. MBLA0076]|uniref:MFS transporter n=1 Tax=Haloferax litoreum TaxID=2666140 RepID=A0A6A8GDJ7_9EURY|nr:MULTISPECIES: MFS transporter [Haloferax]KAB1192762.1 MFS transporter [Haloferax sp. CBA1148]MRX21243.1 MFS transporter [Haloferax litoreum]
MNFDVRDSLLVRNANVRRLILGRLVTNAGDSVYAIAAMWLVYDLTGSSAYTGLAGFLTMAPQAMQVLAGPLVDRWSIRRILVGTQLTQAVLVLVIPLADFLGHLSVWVVLTVMPLVSLLNQLVYPAQSAVVPRLVDDDDLVAANSLLSLSYQGVDLAFNAVAGVLIAATSAVTLYLVDSVSFAIAAGLFVRLSIPSTADGTVGENRNEAEAAVDAVSDGGTDESAGDDEAVQTGYVSDLQAGLGFVRGSILLPLLVSGLVVNGVLGGVWATMPAFADARGGPEAYGFLMAAIAGGMLVGAVGASTFDHLPFGSLTIGLFVFSGVGWLVAIAVPSLAGTVAFLALATVPLGISNVLSVAMIQSLVPESLLGRVMATVGSLSTLMMPVGSALGGFLGDYVGSTSVVAAGGVGLLFVAVYVVALPTLRRLPPIGDIETLSA